MSDSNNSKLHGWVNWFLFLIVFVFVFVFVFVSVKLNAVTVEPVGVTTAFPLSNTTWRKQSIRQPEKTEIYLNFNENVMLKNVHWGESKKGLKSFDSITLNTASSKAINQAFPYFTTWLPGAERAAVKHQWGRNHNRRGSGVTFTTFREEKYNANFQHGARRLWQEWDDQQGAGSSVGDGGSLRGGHGDWGHRRACRRLHPCSKSPLGSPRMGARHHNALWSCRYCYPWQVEYC